MIGSRPARLNMKEEYIIGPRKITIMVLDGKSNRFQKKIGVKLPMVNLIKS